MDNINTLLHGTLSTSKATRLECENELKQLSDKDGFMEALIALDSQLSLIYLKNLLRIKSQTQQCSSIKLSLFKEIARKYQNGSKENLDLLIDCFVQICDQQDIIVCIHQNILKVVENYCRMNAYNDDIKVVAQNLKHIKSQTGTKEDAISLLKIFYFCSRQRIDFNSYLSVIVPYMAYDDLNIKKWAMKVLNRFSNSSGFNHDQLLQHYLSLFELNNVKIKELILSFIVRHHNTISRSLYVHKHDVFHKLILPLIVFNKTDEQRWTDQREFIINYISYNFRLSEEALVTLVKSRDMFEYVANYLVTTRLTNQSELFGYLSCVIFMSDQLIIHNGAQIEEILVAMVFPHLESNEGCIKAMALYCCSKFSKIRYQDIRNLEYLFSIVIRALNSEFIAIRTCALLVIPQFIKYHQGSRN